MENGFKIIGISVRTTNKNNQSAQDLKQLWGRYFSENIFEKIPNKISMEIFSIYTDYKSDYTDEYTVIIGVPVSTIEQIPDGLVGREFSSENFLKYTAKGELPNSVMDTWIDIWQNDRTLNRKYSYDFEVYGEKSQNGKDSEVEIFVAIK